MAKEISGKELEKLLAKPTISVEQAGQIFGLSRNPAYEAVKNKQIPSIRLGRSIKVPTAEIRRMLRLDHNAA
jgi:excisionase family DNA binding protein